MQFQIGNRIISPDHKPFVIAEIGINHNGDFAKAVKMVQDAHAAGCECVKFQCHIVEDEMIPNNVVPGNATESIYTMMQRCSFSEEQERLLKTMVESLGMIYLCTPFGRAAADRLERMGVLAYKIGSGECNNYPLLKHIAKKGKPVILSTGMNNFDSILIAVDVLLDEQIPIALLHCTSMYPTPYDKVNLRSVRYLQDIFGINTYGNEQPIGLSDHSIGNYTSFAAVALGASIIEKHFTSSKSWPGPDIPISIDAAELKDLIKGTEAVWLANDSEYGKDILPEEQSTINFAYASVVSIAPIKKGAKFTEKNIWVKRPGGGDFLADKYEQLLGKTSANDIENNVQIKTTDIV